MSDRTDANLNEARRWLRQADEQVATARWDGEGRFWAAGCFQSQQAAELALKAVLIRQGERAVLTHSLVRLVKHAGRYQQGFAALAAQARRLDRYYIPTRYPNGLADGTAAENFDEEDFHSAVGAAEAIIEAARCAVEPA